MSRYTYNSRKVPLSRIIYFQDHFFVGRQIFIKRGLTRLILLAERGGGGGGGGGGAYFK